MIFSRHESVWIGLVFLLLLSQVIVYGDRIAIIDEEETQDYPYDSLAIEREDDSEICDNKKNALDEQREAFLEALNESIAATTAENALDKKPFFDINLLKFSSIHNCNGSGYIWINSSTHIIGLYGNGTASVVINSNITFIDCAFTSQFFQISPNSSTITTANFVNSNFTNYSNFYFYFSKALINNSRW